MTTVWLLVRAALIVGAGVLAGSWLEGVARATLDRGRLDPAVRELLVPLVRPVVVLLAVVLALASTGADATGVAVVLAALALSGALALRGTAADASSGAWLLTARPYRVGDHVTVAGTTGVVMGAGLLATTLKTAAGAHVTVANRLVAAAAITNHSRNGLVRVEVDLRVPATSDVEKLSAAVIGLLDGPFAKEPAPALRADALDGAGLTLRLSAWARPDDVDAARSALILGARDGARKAKIELVAAP